MGNLLFVFGWILHVFRRDFLDCMVLLTNSKFFESFRQFCIQFSIIKVRGIHKTEYLILNERLPKIGIILIILPKKFQSLIPWSLHLKNSKVSTHPSQNFPASHLNFHFQMPLNVNQCSRNKKIKIWQINSKSFILQIKKKSKNPFSKKPCVTAVYLFNARFH